MFVQPLLSSSSLQRLSWFEPVPLCTDAYLCIVAGNDPNISKVSEVSLSTYLCLCLSGDLVTCLCTCLY